MKVAEYPQRTCREPFTENGLTDHTCDLVDGHPGPPAALSSPESVKRRDAWEAAHPGWEKLMDFNDPFKSVDP